jgi:hypothetical protein
MREAFFNHSFDSRKVFYMLIALSRITRLCRFFLKIKILTKGKSHIFAFFNMIHLRLTGGFECLQPFTRIVRISENQ